MSMTDDTDNHGAIDALIDDVIHRYQHRIRRALPRVVRQLARRPHLVRDEILDQAVPLGNDTSVSLRHLSAPTLLVLSAYAPTVEDMPASWAAELVTGIGNLCFRMDLHAAATVGEMVETARRNHPLRFRDQASQ